MLITPEELALHSMSIQKAYPEGELDDRSGKFHQSAPAEVRARAELEGGDIRVSGRLATRVEVECDRCMARMELPLEQDFDLRYRPLSSIAREEEIEIPRDELEVGFYSGEGIELVDVAKEQLILALPMKIICRPECQGLCPVCGANLNKEKCHCQQTRNDSPFSSLRGE